MKTLQTGISVIKFHQLVYEHLAVLCTYSVFVTYPPLFIKYVGFK